jgi:Tn3 transposase DDE domain
MAWNTHQMQATLDRWRTSGERNVESSILSHITPTGFDKVNFDGVLAFSLEQHRARILPSSSPPEVPIRGVR